MFEIDNLPVEHAVSKIPARLPFSILLCLPDYVTADPGAAKFNIGAVIGRLIGRAGYARAVKVLTPRIWAPAWTDTELKQFVSSPFHDRPELFSDVHPAAIRAA